ncbi:MAG: ABC transporter permease [Crocinitomicaceae bacterium]
MKLSVILSISKTHLFSRKKQTIIAALGVTFGIGAYIIMMSFMTGLNGLLDGLVLNRTPHIHLYNEIVPSEKQPIDYVVGHDSDVKVVHSIKPKQSQNRIHGALALMSFLDKQDYVRGVTPLVKAQGYYMAGSTKLNGSIMGVNVMEEADLYNLNDYIVQGSATSLELNENGILLGKGVADKLSLDINDYVQISTLSGDVYPLKIVGLYQSGLADIDNIQSYVNIKTAQKLMGESIEYITDINVKLYDMTMAPELSEDMAKMYNLSATSIQSANAQFDAGTSIRNMISYAVSITLLIVAGFGIYNILNMLIYEKMNDIAILKATGFSGQDVQRIFISQALIIGFIGGLLGLLVGYLISLMISHAPFETDALPTIKTMPVNFDPMFYIIGIVFAMISTFLAGYFPARKAQRIDPVEIIRGQ